MSPAWIKKKPALAENSCGPDVIIEKTDVKLPLVSVNFLSGDREQKFNGN
jgi:hypothetical protein